MGREEESRRILVICFAAALLALGAAFFLWHTAGETKEEPLPVVELSGKESSRTLLVYVTGAVRQPGVYELPEGSRFFDAVKAAGDVLPYAVMEDINMAEPLSDGMKIHIPLDPEQADARGERAHLYQCRQRERARSTPGRRQGDGG